MFKAHINGVDYDTVLKVERGAYSAMVSLCEVGTGAVLGVISCENKELPILKGYNFYVDTSSEHSYMANQLVSNGLALVRDKKHIRNGTIYLVYRILR